MVVFLSWVAYYSMWFFGTMKYVPEGWRAMRLALSAGYSREVAQQRVDETIGLCMLYEGIRDQACMVSSRLPISMWRNLLLHHRGQRAALALRAAGWADERIMKKGKQVAEEAGLEWPE